MDLVSMQSDVEMFCSCPVTVRSAYSPWDPKLSTFEPSYITGAIIDLRSSKADKTGTGRHLYVSRSGQAESFLLDLLLFWCSVASFSSPTQPFLALSRQKNF